MQILNVDNPSFICGLSRIILAELKGGGLYRLRAESMLRCKFEPASAGGDQENRCRIHFEFLNRLFQDDLQRDAQVKAAADRDINCTESTKAVKRLSIFMIKSRTMYRVAADFCESR